jgi:glycosyltransferase involved in cell wall biosynthesis
MKIGIVIPAYNEEDNLRELFSRLQSTALHKPEYQWTFYFVNDGSKDSTLAVLKELSAQHNSVVVINLSRNFGHQAAVSAGLENIADEDYIGIIDADLQDPPEVFIEMIKALEAGNDLAYGKRLKRDRENFFKLITANIFYKVIRKLTKTDIPDNTGDFRLFNRKVLKEVNKLKEHHKFLRGLFAWVGFKSIPILYNRDVRHSGITKYPFLQMISFAVDAICAFSIIPLRLLNLFGAIFIFTGMTGIIFILYQFLMNQQYIPGSSAIISLLLLISGLNFLCLGIIGEYLGKIFEQVKQRPSYIVDEIIRKNL